jgi:hypothetical protein
MADIEYYVWIPKEIHDKIIERKMYLGELLKDKLHPSTLVRYHPTQLLKKNILIKFTNKKPKFVMYDDTIFGSASFEKNNDHDVCYPIHLADPFSEYLKKHEEFFLEVGYVNDGIGGFFSNVFGTHSNKVFEHEYNFTDFSTW